MEKDSLYKLNVNALIELSTEDGINASGKDEVYGCIFGRDSALTILKILRVYEKKQALSDTLSFDLLDICKRGLTTLVNLQGTEFNIESGEQPGKIVHEFRKEKFDHLLQFDPPWYVYPDGFLKNYDSIDSTPLTMIAIHKYWQLTQDHEFLMKALSPVEAGLNWIITFGDMDKDVLLEYEFHPERKHGGLLVQSWTDSHESVRDKEGKMPKYPVAPVEVQGYAWLALRLWAQFYADQSPTFAQRLVSQAETLKKRFNETFIIRDQGHHYAAQALDGDKNQMKTITGNPLLLLWASDYLSGEAECILDKGMIDDFVQRAFMEDMFDHDAGIRTMSTLSQTYNPKQDSYHNGSYWPILNSLIFEGLQKWGYQNLAEVLREASLKPIYYFGSPVELYMKGENNDYFMYLSPDGQQSCKQQAWSAAGILDMVV